MRVIIDDPIALGRVLRRIREQQGWSQRRLAAALGVGQRYVHELETGRAKRFDTHYLQILSALGVRLVAEFDDDPGDADAGTASGS